MAERKEDAAGYIPARFLKPLNVHHTRPLAHLWGHPDARNRSPASPSVSGANRMSQNV